VLLKGTRYEGTPGQLDYRIVEFDRYAMRIDSVVATQAQISLNATSSLELWRNPTPWNLSQLEWRVGLPISAIILALLAIPLSYVNPRAGRSLNLVIALLLYMVYTNLISATNSWVGLGKISPALGLWGIHSAMLILVAILFYWRMSLFSIRRVLGK
jgi:lipopolysaccharide export system permease protein